MITVEKLRKALTMTHLQQAEVVVHVHDPGDEWGRQRRIHTAKEKDGKVVIYLE